MGRPSRRCWKRRPAQRPVVGREQLPRAEDQPRCVDTKLTSLAAKPGRTEVGGLLVGVEAGEGEAAADTVAGIGVEPECAGRLDVPQAVATARARRVAPVAAVRMAFMPLGRRNALRRWTDGWISSPAPTA